MGRIIPGLIGLFALVVAVVLWLQWRTPAESLAPTSTPDFDTARAELAALPVKGWDRLTVPCLRRTVERRCQRRVRPQRLQHPRRHPAA